MRGLLRIGFMCLLGIVLVSHMSLSQPVELDTLKTYAIDEVIISGTRTPTKIIDIPYSVQRIDNYEYKFDKKVAVDDVLGETPGLFLQSRYGNHDVRISIRGFGSRSNTGIRGVRILQDGIPESEPDGQTRIESIDFQNIGAIEIVKGNASSLYTNAPGGVINFISDLNFNHSSVTQFNEFGSFGLSSNGFKIRGVSGSTRYLATYNYHSSKGYREHSEDYWHIFNSTLETELSERARLSILGYYVSGLIRLPGSLTKEQFEKDPFQANRRDRDERDARRITRKSRVGIRLDLALDEERKNELEITGYGTIKYFERTASTFRIFNRSGVGASLRYLNRSEIAEHKNEFSLGGDLFYQSGPIEEYRNIGGSKGDDLLLLTDETITNAGFFVQNSFSLINERMNLLLTGRLDGIDFIARKQTSAVENANRKFQKFTPKAALNYKLTPTIALYSSYGLGFDTPAGNELDNYPLSTNQTPLLNPDLNPQSSTNFELGIKGLYTTDDNEYLRKVFFEATFFNTKITDEIIPFEVLGAVYFRNAAKTNRTGLELGADAELIYGLRLKTSYTLSNFKYDIYTDRSMEFDSLSNVVIKDVSYTGNVVPSVPKHNFSVSLAYTRVLDDHITGFVKSQFTSVSGMYVDDRNSEKTRGYQTLNLSLGADILFDRFDVLVSGGINNITDKRYVGFVNINSSNKQYYEPGEPRNYFGGIQLGYSL